MILICCLFISQARTMAFRRHKIFACEEKNDMRGGSVAWPKGHTQKCENWGFGTSPASCQRLSFLVCIIGIRTPASRVVVRSK